MYKLELLQSKNDIKISASTQKINFGRNEVHFFYFNFPEKESPFIVLRDFMPTILRKKNIVKLKCSVLC